jgi:hypothetical protein
MPLDNDDIKQLIAILQKGLSSENKTSPTTPTQSDLEHQIKPIKRNEPKTENKFISLGFHNLHKEDVAIDKMLQKNPPTPRNRQFKTIDVKCRVCGRSESINPAVLYESPDRYKCNRCSSSPG